jgi:phage terminase large subunit GpA-like protein
MKTETQLEINTNKVFASFMEGLTPQDLMNIVDFAGKYIDLPEENNPFPGLYDIDRSPFYRFVLEKMEDPMIEEVTVMKGFQIGFTLLSMIYILWRMVYKPTSILFIQPTEKDAKRFVQDKLKPLFERCSPLQKRIVDLTDKKNKDQDTLHRIKFPGGMLNIANAHSPNSLDSLTVEVLIRDENSKYPINVKGQGDPNFKSWGRTAAYKDTRKILTFSTPGQGATCRVTNLYNDRYTERYDLVYFPCPDKKCTGTSRFIWDDLRYKSDYPDNVSMFCHFCKKEFSEEKWKDQYPNYTFKKLTETNLIRKKISFKFSTLYAPIGGFSWGDAVKMYVKSKTDKSNEIAFITNILAMPYYDTAESMDESFLEKRVEPYRVYPLPIGVDFITAGVDINGDFVTIEFVGWGYDFQSWSLDYIHLKDASPYNPKTWDRLHAKLKKTWLHHSGIKLPVSATAIDTGHATQECYDFIRGKEAECIIAIKGSAGSHKPILGNPSTNNLGKIPLYSVGQDAVSATVFARMKVTDPKAPGYCRIRSIYKNATGRNEYKKEYFKEMTSEHCVITYRKGYSKMEWRKKDENARNEAFDCRKYATAALYLFNFDDFNEFLDEFHSRKPSEELSREYRSEVV